MLSRNYPAILSYGRKYTCLKKYSSGPGLAVHPCDGCTMKSVYWVLYFLFNKKQG